MYFWEDSHFYFKIKKTNLITTSFLSIQLKNDQAYLLNVKMLSNCDVNCVPSLVVSFNRASCSVSHIQVKE